MNMSRINFLGKENTFKNHKKLLKDILNQPDTNLKVFD